MNVGEAARQSGLPVKTLRYYDEIGLVRPSARTDAGYRDYSANDVSMLRFVQRSRSLGFSVEECTALLDLYRDRNRASADVREMARQRVSDIERKIAELEEMRATLGHLIDRCHGDNRPECPILEDLAGADCCP
ncbi:Cu(I)-responsive transcriptional regulator [Radicibacter daui]|uniref:Cu(I)-responsive transcriptional regulator n=1 Tax=Radicibacter daui TaxID=3064829 RepID=UPI004046BF50